MTIRMPARVGGRGGGGAPRGLCVKSLSVFEQQIGLSREPLAGTLQTPFVPTTSPEGYFTSGN